MRALIDTHVLLWFIAGDLRLPKKLRSLFGGKNQEIYLSAASAAEIGIKFARRKLGLPAPPEVLIPQVMADLRLSPLAVTVAHGIHVASLPPHHGDPFDRLLIAQAELEHLAIVTGDKEFRRYGVEIYW